MTQHPLNELSEKIIGAAIEVHKTLGPGLLESAYQTALLCELRLQGLQAEKEVPIPFVYKGQILNVAYRADIIVENEIILELKAVDYDLELYRRQILTYLKILDKRLGLIINFHHQYLINGLKRVVNGLPGEDPTPLHPLY